jgi:transitional endoplasmic reticulum ATPase
VRNLPIKMPVKVMYQYHPERDRSTERKTNTMAKKQQAMPPRWGQEFSSRYLSGIAHAFLLHGNVQDYVGAVAGQTLKNYLFASFAGRDVVVYWHRAGGFSFPSNAMKKRFAEVVGLAAATPVSTRSGSGLAAGMSAMAGTASNADPLGAVDQTKPLVALGLLNKLLHVQTPHGEASRGRSASSISSYSQAIPTEQQFRVAVIIDYAETIAPQSDSAPSAEDRTALVMLDEIGRDAQIGDLQHIVVAITSDLHDMHERLRRSGARWEQIEIPFPSFEERSTFIQSYLHDGVAANEQTEVRLADGFTYTDIARLTTGLRYIDLEDIVLRASYQQQPISAPLVKARKDEIVASEFEEVLQIVENEFGFESLGGMSEIKEDLRENVVKPMRSGDYRIAPQGLLFMGPAGTGKTRLAKALAREAGVTFVELQPGKIFSKWVGDTERRLERALTAIKAMTPCMVFIDEIDQAISRGESGDNGVSNRVFKRLMEIMSDTTWRGKILWVAASVTGETPVLVRQQGRVYFAPIGEIIDAYFSNGNEGEEVSPDLETLAVKSDHSVGWSPVKSVYRHKTSEVFDIVYSSGLARITTTGNHSVFVLDEEANITSKRVCDLQAQDLLVIPVQSSVERQSNIALNLVDTKTIQSLGRLEAVVSMAQNHSQRAVADHLGMNQTLVSQYVRQVTQPQGLGAAMPHPVVVLDEDFSWFLGLFTAEGYARKEVCITLGEQEHDLVERAERVMTEKFGLPVHHRVTNGAHHLIIYSAPLARRLKELLGSNAHDKHVPDAFWIAERNLVLAYVKGWIDGDGSVDKRGHITITTVCKSLAYQGVWLLRMNGIAARVEETTAPAHTMRTGNVLKECTAYRLHITGGENPWTELLRQQQNGSHDKRVPVAILRTVYKRLKPHSTKNAPHAYSYLSYSSRHSVSRDSARTILKSAYANRRQDDDIYERIVPFVFGDLGVTPVQRVERRPSNEIVYDFCGCDNECFIGGTLPIMLHNSNRPDLLDGALLRPGRFDKKIPILAPDEEERVSILRVLTIQAFPHVKELPAEPQYQALAQEMVDYTGAEIESVVGKATQLYARAGSQWTIFQALQEAFDRIIPSTQNIEQMTRLALLHCNDLDLVPAHLRDLARAVRKPTSLDEDDQETHLRQNRRSRRDNL